MTTFLAAVFSFPTILFSILLLFAILFWVISMVGAVDIDSLQADGSGDMGADAVDGGLAGLLMKFGLDGVPITIILTLLFLFSWFLSYLGQISLLNLLPSGALRYGAGTVLAVVAFAASFPIVGIICRPIRPAFKQLENPTTAKSVLGQTVIIRTGKVTSTFGEAVLADGGAGLILKVRADEATGLKRGDRAVLLEYLETENAYSIVSEDEFRGL